MPGAACDHQPVDLVTAALEKTDDDLLRQFLGALRRWQVVEESDEPVRITRETVRTTADYVLSSHFDAVTDAETGHTVTTLRGFLAALADAAEADLDTGRVVVREVIRRARSVSSTDFHASKANARHAAETARDIFALLEREGWSATPEVAKEAASA
ncbi:hypothetical protein E0500_039835 [Streptomyces sp. KM273126]|uniref:DUF6415 family natural product biosynthesis protein n=1 Tax=Streptomyces sp. KM273126 TaxID=2545247 RepID=UPI001039C1D3|nr:DUF6415 family natural product biosynthesis protein [Streptomyces sp. KM273126]MBA2813306.1 hypothetical protein [Streptomyces sp. KM273126]